MKKKILLMAAFVFLCSYSLARADVQQIKVYKEAFPDAKPKCLFCHVDALPKKDDGKHELSAYGKKIKEISATPTAETYKKAGPVKVEK